MLGDWFALGFLRRALAAGLLTAISCGLLSPYIVLRRMAFAGHGLSHAAFGGATLALLLGMNLSLGGAIFSGILAIVLALWTRRGEVSEDSAIGMLVAASMALGVVCLSLQKRYTQDVFSFLFGNILAVLPGDLVFSFAAAIVTAVCVLVFARSLVSATFHEELAKVEGVPVDEMRTLLFLLTAVTVVAAMKLVGAILVSALLVMPGAMALLIARRFAAVQLWSLLIGVVAVVAGMFLSYMLDLPSGATIALLLFASYGVLRSAVHLVERTRRRAARPTR
jgi:zinc transport system permease protein